MKIFPLITLFVVYHLSGGSMSLLEQELVDISVGQYRSVSFTVSEYQADNTRFIGSIQITPDTASIELLLLHIDDYLRWRSNINDVDTLEYLLTSSGPIDMEIPAFGSLVLIISNRGNYEPTLALLDMEIHFDGSGNSGDPLPSALRLALIIIMAGAVAVVAGGVMAKTFSSHKRRS